MKHKFEKGKAILFPLVRHTVYPYQFSPVENDDIARIKARMQKELLNPELDVQAFLDDMEENGRFRSIDYASKAKDTWHPMAHLEQLLALQIAYHSEGNPQYHKVAVKNAVQNGLQFWVEGKFTCSWNWWYNSIGIGKYIPDILLFCEADLPPEIQSALLERIKPTLLPAEKVFYAIQERETFSTGGNLTDQILSTLKVAVIEGDANTILWLRRLVNKELLPFPSYHFPMLRKDAEGVKADGSYQQHDQLLYFGGYGQVFLEGINAFLRYTKDTQFFPDADALNAYADFILDGIQFATRAGYKDVNSCGRSITRKAGLVGLFAEVRAAAELLCTLPNIQRKRELTALLDRRYKGKDNGAGGHRYFYESDAQLMNNEHYWASVRAASPRTRIFEAINGENPLGYYTGLGSTFLYAHPDSFTWFLPLYTWHEIPGTTVRKGYMPPLVKPFQFFLYGKPNRLGGVSNGQIGCMAFQLSDHGVHGKKAYFMFSDALVCLGADLYTRCKEPLVTTINQTKLRQPVLLGTDKETCLSLGQTVNGRFRYIYHDGIGYFSDNRITVASAHCRGDFKTINRRFVDSVPIEDDKLTLTISHTDRQKSSYAYTALFTESPDDVRTYAASPRHVIWSNSPKLQAVLDREATCMAAIFYESGVLLLPNGAQLFSNAPCILLLEKREKQLLCTVSSIDGKSYAAELCLDGFTKVLYVNKTSQQFSMPFSSRNE